MAKYIDVEVSLKKIIKVDTDDVDKAMSIAQDEFPDLELTEEWLNDRDVKFKENLIITNSANKIAELFKDNYTNEYLNDFLDVAFGKSDIRNYVYEEILDVLKNKYNVDIVKKDI